MLRCITIGADKDLAEQLEVMFIQARRFEVVRSIPKYLTGADLGRVLRAHAPQVIFLCVNELYNALVVREEIEQTVPGLPVVAFGDNLNQQILLELMKVGVREAVPIPSGPAVVANLGDRLEDYLAKHPVSFDATDMMFTFLPAKPGVGTSTLALNISVAFSRYPGKKTLLMDFDLNSGLIAFMLKTNCPYSVVDAALQSEELDENLWPHLVQAVQDLHVLPSGRTKPGMRIQPAQIRQLLSFARRQYDVICADLSGNMEKYSIKLMEESKRIFLVTTPEIPPLHLARERYSFLRGINLGDRVTILLNRWNKKDAISVSQIEDLLELPVYGTFPNNYNGVHQALVAGKPIDPNSELGEQFTSVVHRIMEPGSTEPPRKKKSFLETFSILPTKYSLSR